MANKPIIRFNEYSDEWEEITLSDIAEIVDRKTDEQSNAPIMMISAASGFINQSEKYSTDNAGSSLKNYILLKQGELAYNHGYSSLRNFGSCFTLEKEEARIPFVYHCFSIPSQNPYFYGYYLNCGIFDKQLRKLVASTARMDGLLNISYSDYTSIKVKKPSKDEQKEIAIFIKNINNLINSTQEKLEKAIILKKSMLEKMFPKDKEKIPELRFKGFSGEWEEQKLGSFVIDYIEKNCSELNYPVLTSSRQGIERQEEHFGKIQNHDTTDYNIIPAGYCAYRSRSDDFIFTFNINKLGYTGIISKYYPVFTFNNCNSYFITEYLNNNDTIKKQITYVATGTGQKVLSHDDFKNFNILIPDLKEQEMIGSFFESIDKLITSYNDELIKLKTIKKSLLEKMFV